MKETERPTKTRKIKRQTEKVNKTDNATKRQKGQNSG